MDALVAELTQQWATARSGAGQLIQLVGAPGIGKSALIVRFVEQLGEPVDGALIVRARFDGTTVEPRQAGIMENLVLRIADSLRAVTLPTEETANVPRILPGAAVAEAVRDLSALPHAADVQPLDRALIHAELLLDIARENPVLIALDDVHRADPISRGLLEHLAAALRHRAGHKLLIVCAVRQPFEGPAQVEPPWLPEPGAEVQIPAPEADDLRRAIIRQLARHGVPSPQYVERILAAANGNPRAVEALVELSERGGLVKTDDGLDDPILEQRPAFAGSCALARCRLPEMPANVLADLETAAIIGLEFDAALLAQVWRVPPEAAELRVEALAATGAVGRNASGWRFWSEAVVAHYADGVPTGRRESIHGGIATVLRTEIRLASPNTVRRIDVTETWSEQRGRDKRFDRSLDRLAAAADHFAAGGLHAESAEAAVTLTERLTDSIAARPSSAARYGRRIERERRHRIYAAMDQASSELELARRSAPEHRVGADLLSTTVRLHAARARFKEALGDLSAARDAAATAVELAEHVTDVNLRLQARRVEVAVAFAAGDNNAGRRALVRLFDELERASDEAAVAQYEWIGQAVARWEWIGLHDRLYPYLIERLHAAGAHDAALRTRVERMAAAIEADDPIVAESLLVEVIDDANAHRLMPEVAELLALTAADLVQGVAEAHYDSLSGEFFPPDLYGESPALPQPSISARLAMPIDLLTRAEVIAEQTGKKVSLLRVLSVALGCIYDLRERLSDLIGHWRVRGEGLAGPLTDVSGALEQGFFEVDHAESISQRAANLARTLGLDQILADTLYEGLDRDLPGLRRQAEKVFLEAAAAYKRVGDTYGQITLAMVETRHLERRELPFDAPLDRARALLESATDELSAEQRGFVHQRLGEYALADPARQGEAAYHLEQALRGYDEAGDVAHVQEVGDRLREVYRELGDLSRYRLLRDRFRALELRVPGADPLGLELRIEHLLSLARQEQNEDRAIEMVERCVQLFGRMPDGTPRIDECFVEISKICRRRADEAQSDAGVDMWLGRSLEAVRTAAAINRELGNFHRVFEEYHELFDDLIGLGAYDDYLRVRAEGRDLAFAVGHVNELMYLFEEHLQPGPSGGFEPGQLLELRSFYEALLRYLLALGARTAAVAIQRTFVDFLTDLSEDALAARYGADGMMT